MRRLNGAARPQQRQPTNRKPVMHQIAFTSPLGGTGQTSLLANLSLLLAQRLWPCLAIDLCAQNGLGLQFGLMQPAANGWAQAALARQWWADCALASSPQLDYLPFGECTPQQLAELERRWPQDPGWLAEQLNALTLDARSVVLLDAPCWPAPLAAQALQCADWIIVDLDASMRACQAQRLVQAMLSQARSGARCSIVINRFDPRCASQRAAVQTLREQWGELLIPALVHQDESVPAAQSQASCVCLHTPDAQAAHDFQDMASWLVFQWFHGLGSAA